jgi:hypothetical protein
MQQEEENFIPALQNFTQLVKQARQEHAHFLTDFIKKLHNLKELIKEEEEQTLQNIDTGDTALQTKCRLAFVEFLKTRHDFRGQFKNFIDDTNFMLGKFTNHWGGYIEQMGVVYMLNLLRKEYSTNQSYEKYRKHWGVNGNIELDLVALNKTTMYIVEIKNQLKAEVIIQIINNINKIKENCPEFAAYKIQPIVMCVEIDEHLFNTITCAGIWIYKYNASNGAKSNKSWDLYHQKPIEVTV